MIHTLVLFCRSAPNPLAHSLEQAGYRVFEAFSEVLHLCEHENVACVLRMSATMLLRK